MRTIAVRTGVDSPRGNPSKQIPTEGANHHQQVRRGRSATLIIALGKSSGRIIRREMSKATGNERVRCALPKAGPEGEEVRYDPMGTRPNIIIPAEEQP